MLPFATMADMKPILLLETGDAPCDVVETRLDGLRLRTDRTVRVVGTVRLAFHHDGGAPGAVRVLAAVDRASNLAEGGGTTLDIRYLALHSTAGRPCLESFLAEVIGLSTPDERAFKAGAGGWFYGFGATRPKPAERRPVERTTGLVDQSQRREKRVAVRVPVVMKVEGVAIKAQAYNISFSGLYILMDEDLPPEGTKVRVAYPVALHARPFTIHLVGDVVWCMPAMTSSQGGGVGVKISQIDDGAGGKAWLEYVAKEVDFGGAVKAAGRAD